MFIFGAFLIFIAPSVITSLQTDSNSAVDREKVYQHKRDVVRVEHIKDITSRAYDVKSPLITYQQIDQDLKMFTNGFLNDSRLYEIKSFGFNDNDENATMLLTTTSSNEYCEQDSLSSLPSWKIDKGTSKGKFRLKINHAELLAGKTLFLCVQNEADVGFHHMGENSRFIIKR